MLNVRLQQQHRDKLQLHIYLRDLQSYLPFENRSSLVRKDRLIIINFVGGYSCVDFGGESPSSSLMLDYKSSLIPRMDFWTGKYTVIVTSFTFLSLVLSELYAH